jgi:alkaline phosphatase
MKKIKLLIIISFICLGSLYSKPKNIIIMIADGMGVNTMSFGDLIYDISELKKFENYGFVKTASKESKYHITDSAAAGTAMSCGQKTYRGIISMDNNGEKLKSIAYLAKEKKKLIGIISNTRITHATPAVFYANNINRDDEQGIAKQIISSEFDLFMGGGYEYISGIEDDIKKSGYNLVREMDELDKIKSDKIIATFSNSHMSYEIERNNTEPSLSEMANFALRFLNRGKNGFFMSIESGRIDHCEHSNDAPCLAYEMKEFKKTLEVIFNFLSKNKDTLFILLADHSNGGLSLGRDGNQILNLDLLTRAKQSSETFLNSLKNNISYKEFSNIYYNVYGVNITEEDYEIIKGNNKLVLDPLNKVANIKWSTDEHEGSYVPLCSTGPSSEIFKGIMDMDEIGKNLFKII